MTMESVPRRLLLVVEDEAQMMRMLREALVSEGFTVIGTRTAEDALARSSTEHPDLIVLDLMLPGLDGIGFMSKMRELPWGKRLPVIVLTNLSPDEKVMRGIVHDEPAYYLIKANTSMDEIVSKIKSVLAPVSVA